MQRLFLVNSNEDIVKSYDDLLMDLNQPTLYLRPLKDVNGLYDLYLHIIISLLHNQALSFYGDGAQTEIKFTNNLKLQSIDDCLEIIKTNNGWLLELATSGTTGVPKKVQHTLQTLTRNIKVSASKEQDVWGLAYNPQHMAGLQVFFQALFNKNTIVNLFGLSKNAIEENIEKYQITHLSATPTFYKLLLPASKTFDQVQQVTFGGEKYNATLELHLKATFPNAKFTNVYASTEAGALFAAKGDVFSIKESLQQLIKIVDNEIFLHQSLFSNSADLKIEDGWYATGDMVSITSDQPLSFQFVSRKNEMINIGGSKVNPNEVEELLMQLDGIVDAKVFGKPNSLMGTILCADVVGDNLTDKDIKLYLKNHLPEYMVPRIIKFVSEIALTSTGKKSRTN